MASDATDQLKRSKIYQECLKEHLDEQRRYIVGTNRPNKGKLILVVNK